MVNKTTETDLSKSKKNEEQIFGEVKHHAEIGFQETDRRAWGNNRIGAISFNEADELFRSWIDENKWPYDALLFDPRVFTFIFEKTSRLISNKPQGKLIPREGSDILAAKVNGSLLDYQWDMANIGGSMISKWALMDINTRKYGAAFALCKWRYECDDDGRILFDGPDMQVLNNRDIAHELPATAIESCNWFQVRQYVTIQDLKMVNDQRSKPVYKNLDKLKFAVSKDKNKDETVGNGGDSRSVNWTSRNRAIAGLEQDPVGQDNVFKTIEIITEYRKDRWITFAPRHGVILRDIPNPYKNNEIPITMLRYYQVDDDLYGLSEIEPVKGLQKAINAILCQYVDEINQQLYSPIAVGPGVRQHTLEWGKGARWIMNNPMTDFRLVESRSNASQYFQTTYSVLVAAMQNALGESSLGTSNVQPFQQDKTATEVKALQLQRNARDNFNQIFLAEAIKRQYMLWHSMNQQLLFSDPTRTFYVVRIVGDDALKFYQNKGLDGYDTHDDMVAEATDQMVGPDGENVAYLAGNNEPSPRYGVNTGNGVSPKLKLDEMGGGGQLYVTPEDLKGTFDFAIDVESMTVNADEERKNARQAAVSLLATNPNVMQLLASEGVKPKFKELFVTWLEDLGFSDAERFFEKSQTPAPGGPGGGPPGAGGGNPAEQVLSSIMAKQGGGVPGQPPTPTGGIPGGTNPNAGGESQQASPFSVDTGTLNPESLSTLFK